MSAPQVTADAEAEVRRTLVRSHRQVRLARAVSFAAAATACALVAVGAWAAAGTATGSGWLAVAAALVAGTIGWARRPDTAEVARLLDRRAASSDAVVVALSLADETGTRQGNAKGAFTQLAFAQAARALAAAQPLRFADLLLRRPLAFAAAMGLVASALMLWSPDHAQVVRGGAVSVAAKTDSPIGTNAMHTRGAANTPKSQRLLAARAVAMAREADRATGALAGALAHHDAFAAVARALVARDAVAVQEAAATLRASLLSAPTDDAHLRIAAALTEASVAVAAVPSTGADQTSSVGDDDSATAQPNHTLERLARELDDAAAGCRQSAGRCAEELNDLAPSLEGLAREDARADAEKLAREAQQTESAVSQDANSPAVDRARQAGNGGEGVPRREDEGEESLAARTAGEQARATGTAVETETVVNPRPGVGASPTAARDGVPETAEPTGTPQDVAVALPAAPADRAALVDATSTGSFDQRGYRAAYGAYRTAVEERLQRASLPADRRETVRRYFHRIRPVSAASSAPARSASR